MSLSDFLIRFNFKKENKEKEFSFLQKENNQLTANQIIISEDRLKIEQEVKAMMDQVDQVVTLKAELKEWKMRNCDLIDINEVVEEEKQLMEIRNSDLRQLNENQEIEISELRQCIYEYKQKIEKETEQNLDSSMQSLSSMQINDPMIEQMESELALIKSKLDEVETRNKELVLELRKEKVSVFIMKFY